MESKSTYKLMVMGVVLVVLGVVLVVLVVVLVVLVVVLFMNEGLVHEHVHEQCSGQH